MHEIGIAGYGAYIPRYRIKVEEIARVWGTDAESIKNGLNVLEKSVPDIDEDMATISVTACRNAIERAGIEPSLIEAIFAGSESHPYVVKPTGTIIAEAVGASQNLFCADLEFACKAGSAAIQICYAMVRAGMIKYGIAAGADCAQGRPGDALEYTAAAGGAAFVIGSNPVAVIEDTASFATDTPDFFRREGQPYPRHAGRFTGEPAYFRHVTNATKALMEKTGFSEKDFDYAVFHMPNGKFPLKIAKQFGFSNEKTEQGLVVRKIGNTYSGSSLLGLSNVLDIAMPGQRILMTSYGSGAGADSFSILVTDRIEKVRDSAPLTRDYIDNCEYLDYGMYAKMKGKLKF